MTDTKFIKILDKIVEKLRTSESFKEIESYIEGIKDSLCTDNISQDTTNWADLVKGKKIKDEHGNESYIRSLGDWKPEYNPGDITWTTNVANREGLTFDANGNPILTQNTNTASNKITPKNP